MAITGDDVAGLAKAYLDCVMIKKDTAAEQQKFFLHPNPTLFLLRGDDMTLQQNWELHQKLTDQKHQSMGWDVTPLCAKPERARAVGTVYWQARVVGKPADQLIKAYLFGVDRAAHAVGRAEDRRLHERQSLFSAGLGNDRYLAVLVHQAGRRERLIGEAARLNEEVGIVEGISRVIGRHIDDFGHDHRRLHDHRRRLSRGRRRARSAQHSH